MNFCTVRVAIRKGISGTPCWILYFHSEIILTHSPTIINKTKKICHRIRTRRTICYISSFISHVYYWHSVLPYPPMHCLSYSLFYMVCKTQMYIYLHNTYIHILLTRFCKWRGTWRVFLWDWMTSISIIHSKSIHFSVKFLITFFFRVDTILFCNIPNFHYSSVDGQLN